MGPRTAKSGARVLVAAIIVGSIVAPGAIFFGILARNNAPGFLNPFGLPWPEPLASVIHGVAVAVVIFAALSALLGIRSGGTARTAGIVSVALGVAAIAPVLFVSFGDRA